MDVLILRCAGSAGPFEIRYALARGHWVTIFDCGSCSLDWPGPVEELVGDQKDCDFSALVGRRLDVCMDNPTTLPLWVRDTDRRPKGQVCH